MIYMFQSMQAFKLPVSGNKADLIARLAPHAGETAPEPAAEMPGQDGAAAAAAAGGDATVTGRTAPKGYDLGGSLLPRADDTEDSIIGVLFSVTYVITGKDISRELFTLVMAALMTAPWCDTTLAKLYSRYSGM